MKIVLLNMDMNAGGASLACVRLHKAFIESGEHSNLLFKYCAFEKIPNSYGFYERWEEQKKTNSFLIKAFNGLKFRLGIGKEAKFGKEISIQKKIISKANNKSEIFTFQNSFFPVDKDPLIKEADIIHLHWVANNFIDFSLFEKFNKPIIWTLHDMNPFTGGCHYSEGCEKFKNGCKRCPMLEKTDFPDYAEKNINRNFKRIKLLDDNKLTIVSPSKWLLDNSKNSKIFNRFSHHLIPYSVNENVFKPLNRDILREKLNIPLTKKVILFNAVNINNVRKGFKYLVKAISLLSKKEDYYLIVTGNINNVNDFLGISCLMLGYIKEEEKMAELYNCADLFIAPSLEDNLPNVVIESLMTGTPVIAFNIGGMPDMINHGINGLLSKEISAEDLSKQIHFFFNNEQLFNRNLISNSAFNLYKEDVQRKRYLDLYKSLLK